MPSTPTCGSDGQLLTWTQAHTAGRYLFRMSFSASRADWTTAQLSSSSRTLRLSATRHTGHQRPRAGRLLLPAIAALCHPGPQTYRNLPLRDFGKDRFSLTPTSLHGSHRHRPGRPRARSGPRTPAPKTEAPGLPSAPTRQALHLLHRWLLAPSHTAGSSLGLPGLTVAGGGQVFLQLQSLLFPPPRTYPTPPKQT